MKWITRSEDSSNFLLNKKAHTCIDPVDNYTEMGIIYLISSTATPLAYIGQTKNPPKERWRNHVNCARQLKKHLENPLLETKFKEKHSYLYNSMALHGIDTFTMQVLIEVPNEELDYYEIEYIKMYNTLRPNGLNLSTGGGHFQHNEVTKRLMSQKAIENAPKLIDKWRKPETQGLPMYIIYVDKKPQKATHRGRQGYAISNHPKCKWKAFDIKKHGSLEACKVAAIAFLEMVEKSDIPNEFTQRKKNPDLPIGITRFRNGYKVLKKINGIEYKKTFEGKTLSDETKLEAAKKYLKEITE
jgi:hypothetical protein